MKTEESSNQKIVRSQSEAFIFMRTKIQNRMKENNFTYDKETQKVKTIEK